MGRGGSREGQLHGERLSAGAGAGSAETIKAATAGGSGVEKKDEQGNPSRIGAQWTVRGNTLRVLMVRIGDPSGSD
jgi:hypothetical protein